ncbi:MAG TPA: acetyltransferase [Pseudogracilibacillus sp.]|nr:acetyltransferase [Pseudogracilibacillus sp.]
MGKLICEKCKGEKINKSVLATSLGQVHMLAENKRGKSSPITADYCNSCGYILSLYVENPNNLD